MSSEEARDKKGVVGYVRSWQKDIPRSRDRARRGPGAEQAWRCRGKGRGGSPKAVSWVLLRVPSVDSFHPHNCALRRVLSAPLLRYGKVRHREVKHLALTSHSQ